MKRRKTWIEKPQQVKVSVPMMEALAKDLQELHDQKVVNLHYWPAAREVVVQFRKD